MQKAGFALAFAVVLSTLVLVTRQTFAASLTIAPTTTLAQEKANNTSASSSFKSQSNGNLGAGNISKVSVRTLLYSGATTKLYARLMPWFGTSYHMNVGYASDDPNQIRRQVSDMLSRGIAGVFVDWYGPNRTPHNTTVVNLVKEAELRNGRFTVSISLDRGAFTDCEPDPRCDRTQRVIDYLNYAYNKFENSSAYMRINGRPVVSFFDVEALSINWDRVRRNVQGNPLLVFRNSVGFNYWYSEGSYGWIGLSSDPNNMGLGYLDNFYNVGLSYPNKFAVGSSYKGFNDTLAAWGKNRILKQHCGQTWLATMAELKKFYSSSNQLDALLLVTWNDYEEGSELESGIDNCVSISAWLSGATLKWSITGQQNTVNHFTVFISKDGTNLMKLVDVSASSRSLDLRAYSLAAGTYKLFVKAIGKPMLRNHISGSVTFAVGSYSTASTSTRAVNITQPSSGATLGSPVHVTASALSPATVKLMQIYLDGAKVYETAGAKFDTYVRMSAGYRRVTAQAYDSAGVWFKKTIYVTVK